MVKDKTECLKKDYKILMELLKLKKEQLLNINKDNELGQSILKSLLSND